MSKVIQIRDVPDEVHAAVQRAADQSGLSLSGFFRAELEQLARRAAVVEHNDVVIGRTRSRVGGTVPRGAVQSALQEVRGA